MSSAMLEMAKKHGNPPPPPDEPEKGRRGRPKAGGKITYRYAVVATPEYRLWMDQFMDHLGELEAADVWRDAMRHYAVARGFRPPPSL